MSTSAEEEKQQMSSSSGSNGLLLVEFPGEQARGRALKTNQT